MRRRAAGVAVACALVARPGAAGAQEDFRSLDLDRPLRVVDAYPKKFLEWELQLGARGEWAEARRGLVGSLEVETGLFRNFELGVEVEPAFENVDGEGSASGLEGAGLHALYNFNQESWSWPALAVQGDVEAPLGGGPGREEWAYGGRLIATRSFASRLRLHANAGYLAAAVADGDDVWLGGLAFDRPIGLFSRLILGGVFAEIPVESGRARVWAELGTRLQLTNLSVLDLGLATRLDEWADGRASVELVAGFSRIFSVRPLVRAPPYPDPAIR